MSKNATFWTVLVLIAILVGSYFMWIKGPGLDQTTVNNPDSSSTNDTTTSASVDNTKLPRDQYGNVIVRYTSTGFVPTSLTLSKGDGVTFRNDSDTSLQISPADPVNEPYATFDQEKASLGAGGTYSYTFTTIGSYTYFNQNMKTDTGKITVK